MNEDWRFVFFDPVNQLEVWRNIKTGEEQDRLPKRNIEIRPLEDVQFVGHD